MSSKVLIIGKRQDIMDMVTESLETSGFRVTGSLNPAEAINILASNDFEAVVVSPAIPTATRERLILEISLVKPGIVVVQPADPHLVAQAIEAAFSAQMS